MRCSYGSRGATPSSTRFRRKRSPGTTASAGAPASSGSRNTLVSRHERDRYPVRARRRSLPGRAQPRLGQHRRWPRVRLCNRARRRGPGLETRDRRLRLLDLSAQRHRDVLRLLRRACRAANGHGGRAFRARAVQLVEHRGADGVFARLELHLRAIGRSDRGTQSAVDAGRAAGDGIVRAGLPGARGAGFCRHGHARRRPRPQRFPLVLVRRRRPAWAACQRGAPLAGHDDGAGLRQRLSRGYSAPPGVLQSVLARARHHLGCPVHGGLPDRIGPMSHETDRRDPGDVGPGFMDAAELTIREGIARYVIGFVLACVLTAASFYVLNTSLNWGPGIPVALIVRAIAQMGVHLVFFLHITTAPDNTNNVLALAFGVLIVALVIAGSLWIMDNLNQNMVPMHQMMQMQR